MKWRVMGVLFLDCFSLLMWQNCVHQQRGAFGHAARPASGAKTPAFATEDELATIDDDFGSRSLLAKSTQTMEGVKFLLVSRRQHGIYNSVGHILPALAKKVPYNPVFMNPEDAAELDVGNGDQIQLATAHATVFGTIELAGDICPPRRYLRCAWLSQQPVGQWCGRSCGDQHIGLAG